MNNLELDKGIGKGKPLDATDFANGDNIDTSLNDGDDPIRFAIENGHLFEGDIELSKEDLAIVMNETKEGLISSRAATNIHKWPKSGSYVNVPYVVSSSFGSNERAVIAKAVSEFGSKTCIRYHKKINKSLESLCSIILKLIKEFH